MPPKAKFSKNEIVAAAYEIVKEEGRNALTARAIGKQLGSSTRPIFSVFENMDEVKRGVYEYALSQFNRYIQVGLAQEAVLSGVALQYIKFAHAESEMFKLLFLSDMKAVEDEEINNEIIAALALDYALSEDRAKLLFEHLKFYIHGIAVMVATGECKLTEKELAVRINEALSGIMSQV